MYMDEDKDMYTNILQCVDCGKEVKTHKVCEHCGSERIRINRVYKKLYYEMRDFVDWLFSTKRVDVGSKVTNAEFAKFVEDYNGFDDFTPRYVKDKLKVYIYIEEYRSNDWRGMKFL